MSEDTKHFLMRARPVGEDWCHIQCLCGWQTAGKLVAAQLAARAHIEDAPLPDDYSPPTDAPR